MTRKEEWDEFQSNLLSCALKRREGTTECEYLHQRREQIDEMLTTNLMDAEKELGYRQGIRDCVWLFKSLGVLA
ncbi:MAG: hypothetical protein EOM52_08100 [Clostridia bacterium]|nr:hypothetical protein [Clostridia bacterium]